MSVRELFDTLISSLLDVHTQVGLLYRYCNICLIFWSSVLSFHHSSNHSILTVCYLCTTLGHSKQADTNMLISVEFNSMVFFGYEPLRL